MGFYDLVYETVRRIPSGRVATYGQIAMLCGRPNAARAVGTAMAKNPYGDSVPCHRVVNSQGKLTGERSLDGWQCRLLEQEGVIVSADGTVNLKRYIWRCYDE